jgi:hypothetical protein
MTDELTPTPASEWPKNVAVTVTLPSGGVAKLRKPDTFALIRQGKVPRNVVKIIARSHQSLPITEAEAMTMLEFLIAASFISPEVTTKRTAGALYIGDMDAADKSTVLTEMGLVTP